VNYLLSHKIFSVVLAFLVLLSTLSFTVEKHFCGDKLVDVSLFSQAKNCCKHVKPDTKVKKSCCKNEVDIVKGQDELSVVSIDDVDFNSQLLLVSYVYTYTAFFESLPKPIIPHKDYIPPNLVVDIQLLDDVFLI